MGKVGSLAGGILVENFSPNESAKLATNSAKLARKLASEAQMAEVGNKIIPAGELVEAARLSQQYGGTSMEWIKQSSYSYPQGGLQFETHWYENLTTGRRVEYKTKLKLKGK